MYGWPDSGQIHLAEEIEMTDIKGKTALITGASSGMVPQRR